jgi:hypothetical protein
MYGGAGHGADEVARRAAEKEARLEAELANLRQWRANWEAGAAGERAVAAELCKLLPAGWRSIHDVHWPGRPQANLDHVVVGPGGIVVVDAKNWTGAIPVDEGVVRQNGNRRPRLAEDASSAVAALAVLLEPRHRSCVKAAVCFVQQPIAPALLVGGTTAVGLQHLGQWLLSLPVVLSASEVHVIHEYLAKTLSGPTSPIVHTTATLARTVVPAVHEPSAAARSRAGARGAASRSATGAARSRSNASRSSRSNQHRGRAQGAGCGAVLIRLAFVLLVIWLSLTILPGLISSVFTSSLQKHLAPTPTATVGTQPVVPASPSP